MKTAKRSSKAGFTLVEALIALLVLTIGMLAIFEGLVLYAHMNLVNLCRDEAVRIAEEKMNYLRNLNEPQGEGNETVTRKIKNFSRNFIVSWKVDGISSKSYTLKVKVSWRVARKEYQHSVVSIASRAE